MDVRDWSDQALGIAAGLELRGSGSEVLASATHLVLRLKGTDVVAKVGPRGELQQFAREVSVVRHLQALGALCVPLSERLAPGPHVGVGIVTSFWKYLPPVEVESEPSLSVIGHSLEQLHDALASYAGELHDFLDDIPYGEGLLQNADRRRLSQPQEDVLRRVLQRGFRDLANRRIERVPLHGDAHTGNFKLTVEGPRWFDFEAACRGPREWDIVAGPYPPSDTSEPELLRVLRPIRAAFAATFCSLKQNPNEAELECIEYHTGQLASASPLARRGYLSGRAGGLDRLGARKRHRMLSLDGGSE
jgi:hypothetical protein